MKLAIVIALLLLALPARSSSSFAAAGRCSWRATPSQDPHEADGPVTGLVMRDHALVKKLEAGVAAGQSRSTMPASAWPKPMHIVAMP